MPNQFKVSLYIRVSTDRQANEGDSLDEQEKELKRFCEFKQFHIHKVHIEAGRSAKDTKRPEYQKLLADIQAENISAVVVKKLDRLSRSLLDFEGFMATAQKHKVEFISLKENFDTTNAMGAAMLRVALVFAQLEREQLSERVSDVMIYRAQQGLYNGGGIPYGYDVINKELVPHKQQKKVVEFIFDKFIETRSTTQVTKELNALGFHNHNGQLWDRRHIDKILRKPVYLGKIKWANGIHAGAHQPLVTDSKFNAVQDIFNRKQFASPRNKIGSLLKGLLACGHCGSYMSPNYARNRHKKLYYYYRCLSVINQNKPSSDACRPYVAYPKIHALVVAALLEQSTETSLAATQAGLDQNNEQISKALRLLKAQLQKLESGLAVTKQKKELYLNSLIAKDFTAKERERINEKIDEFSLTERQTQAEVYRQQFLIAENREQIISIEPFKQAAIQFKINQPGMSDKDLAEWLTANVQKIVYKQGEVSIEFKQLIKGS